MTTPAQPYRDLAAFIRLGRPYFLAGGFVMHALGVGAALYAGASLNWLALVLGQVAITATQWTVHYANEYFDQSSDRLNSSGTIWSGGSRVLPNGELEPRIAYRAALALACVAIAAAIALVVAAHASMLALLLILVTLFLAWGYSAPPFAWQARGFGVPVTALILSVLTPCLGFYLQAGYIAGWLAPVLWSPFCLHLVFQISVDFPDASADTVAGKRTLVVRNPRAARALYMASLPAAYLTPPLMLAAGLPTEVILASLVGAPVAAWLFVRASRGALTDPRRWVLTEWGSIVLLILTAAAEALGFFLASA